MVSRTKRGAVVKPEPEEAQAAVGDQLEELVRQVKYEVLRYMRRLQAELDSWSTPSGLMVISR